MRKTAISILTLSTLCFSATVSAAGQLKPGLWGMTVKSDAMKNMPKIPPEQLEQMKKMGVKVPQMQDGAMVHKVCISREMAERDQPPQIDRKESGCQSKNYQRSANGYSLDMVCDGPHLKGIGKVTGTFSGNESFSSSYDFKGTAQGRPVEQKMETTGKWLSADCGDVKSMGEMAKK
jgi:hypothetical protein